MAATSPRLSPTDIRPPSKAFASIASTTSRGRQRRSTATERADQHPAEHRHHQHPRGAEIDVAQMPVGGNPERRLAQQRQQHIHQHDPDPGRQAGAEREHQEEQLAVAQPGLDANGLRALGPGPLGPSAGAISATAERIGQSPGCGKRDRPAGRPPPTWLPAGDRLPGLGDHVGEHDCALNVTR